MNKRESLNGSVQLKRNKCSTLSKKYHKSNQHDRSLIEYNPDPIFIFDEVETLTYVNAAAERVTGYVEEELKANYLSLIVDEDKERMRQMLKTAMYGQPQQLELSFKHKQGGEVCLRCKNIPIKDEESGKVSEIITVCIDISPQKQMEVMLRDEKEKYELLAAHMTDLITLFDVRGKVKYASPSHQPLFGFIPSKQESLLTYIHPDDQEHIKKEFRKMIQTKQPGQSEFRYPLAEEWQTFEYLGMPVLDQQGEVESVVVVSRDISKRKLAEQAVMEAEAKYRILVEDALVGVYMLQEDKIVYANPQFAQTFGYSSEEIVTLTFEELIVEEDRLIVKNIFNQSSTEQMLRPLPVRGLKKDQSIIYFEVRGRETTFNGQPATIGTLLDITERKKAQDLLLNSEKFSVISQMAAGIAHEIRNPLTALKGFMQLMQSKNIEDRKYYDIMLSELERINIIVSEFLLLAKPQAVNFQSKDLLLMITQVKALLETQAIINNVQIITKFPTLLPWIKCEENQLKQVFINILKNAIEAMPQGGTITIEVKLKDQDQIVIRISDEGCGIPKERLSRLGEPFYSTKEKGTGLGLMVSFKIIEEHKGKIRVRSKINQGTTVELTLPIVK